MAGPIKLGVAPIAWSNNDLLELGGDTTLETCLKESRKAGFTGTETGVKFPMDPKVLGPILKKHKLALISGWFSGELLNSTVKAEQERMMAQIDTYKALGAPAYVYAETTGTVQNKMNAPLSSRPRLPEAEFPAYGRKLTELAEWMADYGVPMTYHHHMGTIVETAARDRPPHAPHRQGGRAPPRHRASHLRRRRRGRRRRGGTAGASTTSTARTCAPTC